MMRCKKCDGDAIVAIEYPHSSKYHYDGISEFKCFDCGYREGRWCGEELRGSEVERPFCDGSTKHRHEVIL